MASTSAGRPRGGGAAGAAAGSTSRRTAPRPAPRRRGLMTRHGVDAVQLAEVADRGRRQPAARVPLFPRPPGAHHGGAGGLCRGDHPGVRPPRLDRLPADLEEATRVFIEAACDTIEAKGAGPWHLLDSKGPDPEVARFGQQIMRRLTSPWHTRISRLTGMASATRPSSPACWSPPRAPRSTSGARGRSRGTRP